MYATYSMKCPCYVIVKSLVSIEFGAMSNEAVFILE